MKPSPADTHVVIAGAGIAGLAAAMILAEAGVRVTLCEAASEAGGKAKSLRLADGHPTEHSLRVYTDTYQTLLTLFSRIPTEHDRTEPPVPRRPPPGPRMCSTRFALARWRPPP